MPSLVVMVRKTAEQVEKLVGADEQTRDQILAALSEVEAAVESQSRKVARLQLELFRIQCSAFKDDIDQFKRTIRNVTDLSSFDTDYFSIILRAEPQRYLHAEALIDLANLRGTPVLSIWRDMVENQGRLDSSDTDEENEQDTDQTTPTDNNDG